MVQQKQQHRQKYAFSLLRFLRLGSAVLFVFGVSLAPFVWTGQASALLARLFPFTRGLCHAYWAPNLWALYAGADRCLILGKDSPQPSKKKVNS